MSDFVDRFFATDTRSDTGNRRAATRINLLQFVELRLGEEIFRNATTMDLSVDGMRVQSSHPVETGTSVFIMFKLPGPDGADREITGEYTAIHSAPENGHWLVGLRAYNLTAANRAAIATFIDGAPPVP